MNSSSLIYWYDVSQFMLSINNLSVSFNGHCVLDELSFHIHNNSKNVVVGGNGSGKSTFLKCLIGLVIPDKGSILFNGSDLESIEKEIKISSNMPECYRLLPLNVADIISAYSELKNFESSAVIAELKKFNLTRILHQKPWKLSTGEQKILFSLIAMSGRNNLVILDEPFENIDFERKELFFSIVNGSSSNIILSTHDTGILGMMEGWQMFLLIAGKLIGPLDPTNSERYYFNFSDHDNPIIKGKVGNRNFSVTLDDGEIPLTKIENVSSLAGRL